VPTSSEQLVQAFNAQDDEFPNLLYCGTDRWREINLYTGKEPARNEDIALFCGELASLFPAQNPNFWTLLAQFIAEEAWPAQRLADALRHVAKNHVYKTLTIADVMQYNRNVRIYSYAETGGTMNYIKLTAPDSYVTKRDYMQNPGMFDVDPNAQWLVEQWKKEEHL